MVSLVNAIVDAACNLSSEKPATETKLNDQALPESHPAILVQRNQQLKRWKSVHIEAGIEHLQS